MYKVTLKAARVNANLRQQDIAERMGINKSTIMNWEKGKTCPRTDQLRELCDIYNVPVDAIFLP